MRRVLAGIVLALTAAQAGAAPAPRAKPKESGRVRDVVAPDAIRVTLRNRVETIQMVGLDASDYERAGKDVEDIREKAIEYAAGLALGQTVELQIDPRAGERNSDGRLLRYVILPSGGILNAEMVTGGWVRVAAGDFGRAEEYRKLEQEARAAGRGLWKGGAGAVVSAGKPVVPKPGAARPTPTPVPTPRASATQATTLPPIATPAARTTPSPGKPEPPPLGRVATPAPAAGKAQPTPAAVARVDPTPAPAAAARTPAPPAAGKPPVPRKPAKPASDSDLFCFNPDGIKYHYKGCRFLGKDAICVPWREAARAHLPCRTCQPPWPDPSR